MISSQHARTVASLSFLSDFVRPTTQTHTMSNTYQRLPTEDGPSVGDNDNEGVSAQTPEPDYSHRPLRAASQAEFNRPPPSWWKRALLILSLVFMLWLTLKLGGMGNQKSKVIYASRFVFPRALAGSSVRPSACVVEGGPLFPFRAPLGSINVFRRSTIATSPASLTTRRTELTLQIQ